MVSDDALDLPIQGGAAAAAGKASAVVANKAKKGAGKAKEGAVKAKKVMEGKLEEAKPGARKFADAAGSAIESGSYKVGEQLGKASGMFSAFKEEFDKASRGEGEDD